MVLRASGIMDNLLDRKQNCMFNIVDYKQEHKEDRGKKKKKKAQDKCSLQEELLDFHLLQMMRGVQCSC